MFSSVSKPIRWPPSWLVVLVSTGIFALFASPLTQPFAWLTLILGSTLGLLYPLGTIHSLCREVEWKRRILCATLALHAVTLWTPISLSDDVYRYLFDGILVLDGRSPFAHLPAQIAHIAPSLEALLPTLNSPEYYSVYPPLAQVFFGLGAWLELHSALGVGEGIRLVFVAIHLLGVAILLRYTQGRASIQHAALYALTPLVYWEVAAGIHTEALMLLPLLGTWMALKHERVSFAAIGLACTVLIKLSALLWVPLVCIYVARRYGLPTAGRFGALLILTLALGIGPALYADPQLFDHLAESLALFRHTFIFNGPAYALLRGLSGYEEGVTPSTDAMIMPVLEGCQALLFLFCALKTTACLQRLTRMILVLGIGWLLLSRVFHPWYLLPFLGLATLIRARTPYTLALFMPLSYLAYTEAPPTPWLLLSAQYVPFLGHLILCHFKDAEVPVMFRLDSPSTDMPPERSQSE